MNCIHYQNGRNTTASDVFVMLIFSANQLTGFYACGTLDIKKIKCFKINYTKIKRNFEHIQYKKKLCFGRKICKYKLEGRYISIFYSNSQVNSRRATGSNQEIYFDKSK